MYRNDLYNSPNLANCIKSYAKQKNISLKSMLESCDLGKNTFSHMLHGRAISFDKLAYIADYLECSVDYLLGRTDVPTYEDIEKFNALNEKGKEMVIEYIRMLSNNNKYKKESLNTIEDDGYEIAAFGGKETIGVPEDTEPEITT